VLDSAAIKICFAAAEVLREAFEVAATEMSQGDSSQARTGSQTTMKVHFS
jgi:hypothetical protein